MAYHYLASPALELPGPPSPGEKVHAFLRVPLSFELCFQLWGGLCAEGWGRMPGMQICTQAVICTNAPWCAHFQPVPRTVLSLQSQQRAIYSSGQGEGRQALFPHGNSPAQEWLALLAAVSRYSANLAPKQLRGPKSFCWKASNLLLGLSGSCREPTFKGRWDKVSPGSYQ